MFDKIKNLVHPKHAVEKIESPLLDKLNKPDYNGIVFQKKYHPPKSVKPDDGFLRSGHLDDNMNYYMYEAQALFLKTNRIRTIKGIEAFNETEAIEELNSEHDYDESSIKLSVVPFERPTENQLEAMKQHGDYLPSPACKEDVTALISMYMDDDTAADIELIRFAESQRLKFSYYIGQMSLAKLIYHDLNLNERLAFYMCFVSADAGKTYQFSRFNEFIEVAKSLRSDKAFMNSFEKYYTLSRFSGLASEQSDNKYRTRSCYKRLLDLV